MAPKRETPQTQVKFQPPSTTKAVQSRRKSKKVVSTAALFAQIPKLKAAAANSNPQLLTQKACIRNAPLSPKKESGYAKKAPEHPLAAEFNDSTDEYSASLFSAVESDLTECRDALLERLDNISPETLLNTREQRLADHLATPFAEEMVGVRKKDVVTGKYSDILEQSRLGDRMVLFQRIIDKEERVLIDLKNEHDAVMKDIHALSRQILNPSDEDDNEWLEDSPTPLRRNLKQNKGQNSKVRLALDQQLMAKIKELEKEISVLGDEEIEELKKESESGGAKRKKLVKFLQWLEEDD